MFDWLIQLVDSIVAILCTKYKRPGFGRGVGWEGLGALDFFEAGGFATETAEIEELGAADAG
jgi:hypothetical protein